MSASRNPAVIKFFCSTCEQKLSVSAGLEGRKFSCPNCATPSLVPGPTPPERRVNGKSLLKFFCFQCGQKLSCESGTKRSKVDCPICGKSTPIPTETDLDGPSPFRKASVSSPDTRVGEVPPIVSSPATKKIPESETSGASGSHEPKREPEAKFPKVKPAQVILPDEPLPEVILPDEALPEAKVAEAAKVEATVVKTTKVKTTEVKTTEVKPTEVKTTEVNPSAVEPEDGDRSAMVAPKERVLMGSVSPEELFESLEDLGFEVNQASVRPRDGLPGKDQG